MSECNFGYPHTLINFRLGEHTATAVWFLVPRLGETVRIGSLCGIVSYVEWTDDRDGGGDAEVNISLSESRPR